MHFRMDWRSVQFDWNRARAFLVSAEEGSFAAASRALGVAQPTVGRQVMALEEQLGVTLFERVGPQLQVTVVGQRLLAYVRAMADAAREFSLVAAAETQELTGKVSISATEAVAVFLLPPVIKRIRARYPGIEIELLASLEVSDLRRREADLALRNFRPKESDLIARRLADLAVRLYGTPEYLARFEATPEGLAEAAFAGFGPGSRMQRELNEIGVPVGPRNFPLISANHLVLWELTKQGDCLCLMPEVVGEAEPRVQQALPELPAMAAPLWLTSHREIYTNPRMRAVAELLVEALGGGRS